MSAGNVAVRGDDGAHVVVVVGFEAGHLGVGVQVDTHGADRVGDERAHVGIERRHRLRPASTIVTFMSRFVMASAISRPM